MEPNDAPGASEAKVRSLADEALTRMGYELVDLQYRREPSGWTVRLFIDKPGGVGLEDCRRVSEEFGTLLEVEDAIPHRYLLEVSSPGLDRPLRKESHFVAAVGRRVKVVTKRQGDGRRNYAGELVSVSPREGNGAELHLTLRDEAGAEHVLALSDLERAHVVHEWPEPAKPGRPGERRTKAESRGADGTKGGGRDR